MVCLCTSFTARTLSVRFKWRKISRRDQLSHSNTNIVYVMSTRFSSDIMSSAARCRETRRQREESRRGRERWRERMKEREEERVDLSREGN